MDLYQTVLPSGRGVRFRVLTATQHDDGLLKAAQIVGMDAGPASLSIARARECTKLMVAAVTASTLKSADELATATWTPITCEKLEMDPALSYDKLFTAKDAEALVHLFRTYHELTKAEGEAIVGKVQTVSVD